tara:strand:- start:385 stop:1377 length:993 start_codon:yes stop_codon:yes gene_type:complete
MRHFRSNSPDELYYYLLERVNDRPDNTKGTTVFNHEDDNEYKECSNISLELISPSDNKISIKNKQIDYNYADSFFDFMMMGEKFLPEKFLNKYPHTKRFLDSGELPKTFSAAYGPKIKRQLPKVIELFKKEPRSRWGIINILLEEDKKIWEYKTTMEYPCCISFQFNINDENKLNMIANMRSQNIVTIFPYDLYLFTRLQIYVANKLGLKLGSYYHNMGSAHFFQKNQEDVDKTLIKFESSGRGIVLNKEIDKVINWIYECSKGKYNKSEIDPKLFILGKKLGMGFNIGNAAKYLSRYISNSGKKLYNERDLLKSIHYILLEMKRRSIKK